MFNNRVVLITGGTGSLGQKMTAFLLSNYNVNKIIIYSRDEYKQWLMGQKIDTHLVRYFIGDVRDKERMYRAFEGVDYVIHAAALKQVPALEYNPIEAVRTNVIGSENVINVASDVGVTKSILISSDKAVNPINLYGATKLVAEKLFISGNAYVGGKTVFSVVRYGNVFGSRGSIIPSLIHLKNKGEKVFPITDMRMTRFWITLDQCAILIRDAMTEGLGGEIFVPRIPSMSMVNMFRSIDPEATFNEIGIRPGEKIHEILINTDEAKHTKIYKDLYVILPQFSNMVKESVLHEFINKYTNPVPSDFIFSSDTIENQLSIIDCRKMISELKI